MLYSWRVKAVIVYSHLDIKKTGGRLPLLSTRPAVTPVTLKRTATSFAAW